jgi:C4-dicarboxylate-specific signal transduction histidine kinase
LKSRVAVGVRVAEQDRRLREFANHMETIANDRARQLIHADRMASLGIMAAGIVHEVNNPLTMVSGNLQLLEKFWEDLPALVAHGANTPEDEMKLAFIRKELPGVVQGMRKGVTMISRITSALRTYSRKESGNILPCDLNSCISDALEVTGHIFGKKGVAVKADLAPSLPLFMGNAHQIEQVLINLFINAADAMEEADKRELSIATSFDGQRLKTVVQDTGPGVPVSIIDKIWLPFFTTKTSGKGTGLGLSVSQTIMQAHGGTISVANASPAGAVFTLLLPVGRN